jgi:hypothetical protein
VGTWNQQETEKMQSRWVQLLDVWNRLGLASHVELIQLLVGFEMKGHASHGGTIAVRDGIVVTDVKYSFTGGGRHKAESYAYALKRRKLTVAETECG